MSARVLIADAEAPAPSVLWRQAANEHPNDDDARVTRYRELMINAGHLIPGKSQPLPCGFDWSIAPNGEIVQRGDI